MSATAAGVNYDASDESEDEARALARVGYETLGDIVVWLELKDRAATANPPPAVPAARLEITPTTPREPRVVVASVGGTVVVRNSSPQSEVIYSVSDGNEFAPFAIASGNESRLAPRAAGVLEVLCESRENPIALVYVAPLPWVQTTRSGTEVVFEGVPPGRYVARGWHPRLPGSHAEVTLTAGRFTRAEVTVGVNTLPSLP